MAKNEKKHIEGTYKLRTAKVTGDGSDEIVNQFIDGNGNVVAELDTDGNLTIGKSTYPAASIIEFGHKFFKIGSINNGRDFRFYSAGTGGGGSYGFEFFFNNTGNSFNIRNLSTGILLSTLDSTKGLFFQSPYSTSQTSWSAKPILFSPTDMGYYPSALDIVLAFRNYADNIADTSVVKIKTFLTRNGNLSFNTSAFSTDSVKATITIKNGINQALDKDGETEVKIRTGNTLTQDCTFPFAPNAAIPSYIHIGTILFINDEYYQVIALNSKLGIKLDRAVNLYNGGDGFSFSYLNPYLHFEDESGNIIFQIDSFGITKTAGRTKQLDTIDTVYSVKSTDERILLDGTNNPVIITLPSISSFNHGQVYFFKAIDITNTLTINTDGSDLFDEIGATSYVFSSQYEKLELQADYSSGKWIKIN